MVPLGRIERPYPAYKAGPLPLRLQGRMVAGHRIELRINRLWAYCETTSLTRKLEPQMGVEPMFSAWKADVLAIVRLRQLAVPEGIEPSPPAWQAGIIATRP